MHHGTRRYNLRVFFYASPDINGHPRKERPTSTSAKETHLFTHLAREEKPKNLERRSEECPPPRQVRFTKCSLHGGQFLL
jgi:hypothetical protein